MVWLLEQALRYGRPGDNYWWCAPVFQTARIAFRRYIRGITGRDLIRDIQEPAAQAREGNLSIGLPRDVTMWFKSMENADSLYGDDVKAAVIDEASRCFVAGTPVDTPSGPRPIETLRAGDYVLNAAGVGHVTRTIRKRAPSLVAVMVQGYNLVSSPDHRYFTQRGWIEAQDLGPTDTLLRQSAAVRLVQHDVPAVARQAPAAILLAAVPARGDAGDDGDAPLCVVRDGVHSAGATATDTAFLRAELLREMADDPSRRARESSGAGDAAEGQRWSAALLGAGYGANTEDAAGVGEPQRDGRPVCPGQSGGHAPRTRASAAVAGRQGAWPDDGAAGAMDRAGRRVGLRVRGAHLATSARSANVPLSGLGVACEASRGRSRWQHAPAPHSPRGGSAQDYLLAGARVERVEVLQPGDSRFAAYSGGGDTVLLYDLAVSEHPSFAVNGFLVHNCREASWHAVRSTLTATRGPVRIIGNVKGRKNWAYRLARLAEQHMQSEQQAGLYHYAKLTAYDAVEGGVLAADEISDAKEVLPEHIFKQLYMAEPADDGGNPFGLDAIKACLAPLSDRQPSVWGWDIARWEDFTVGVALDRTGTVCRFERFQHADWQVTLQRIRAATGKTPAWVDATHGSVGDPILGFLQIGHDNYHGFEFTTASKQQLIEALVLAVQRGRVHFPPGPIENEMESFEYEFTRTGVRYTAPEGMHDDCVIGLALANFGRGNLPLPGAFATRAARGWNPG